MPPALSRLLGRSAVLLALAVGMTACAGGTAPLVPPTIPSGPSTSSASASAPPATPAVPGTVARLAELRAVEAAYRRFWVVAGDVDKHPAGEWRAILSEVAVDPLLTQLLDGYAAQTSRGLVEYGAVAPRPRVADLRSDRASIVDCQDASRAGQLDVESGQPRAVGSARTLVTAALRRAADGTWRVSEARYQDGTC